MKPKFALSLRVINFIGDLIMMSGVFVAQTKFTNIVKICHNCMARSRFTPRVYVVW